MAEILPSAVVSDMVMRVIANPGCPGYVDHLNIPVGMPCAVKNISSANDRHQK